MWLKLVLLCLYLLSLFIVSRFLEAAAWYEAGFLSYRILDPFSLSVRKLKRLLETRGISYAGVTEKQELTSLVDASGEVMDGELLDARLDEDGNSRVGISELGSATCFTGGSHFNEEVEDTKDSIWLVQVIPHSGSTLLDDVAWYNLRARVAPFSVRSGVFDCSVDKRFCLRKGWTTPQLLLALPRGHRAKDSVILHSYPANQPPRLQLIMNWLQVHLSSRVREVSSASELKDEWLTYCPDCKGSEVRLLLFSTLVDAPLFLLALGVKFSGRVRVGIVRLVDKKAEDHKSKDKAALLEELRVKKLPAYLVITPESTYHYGRRIGEHLNYQRLELFLRSLRPEMNDMFIASLALVNLFVGLDCFLMGKGRRGRVQLWRYLAIWLWRLAKANFTLFFFWLVIVALNSFSIIDHVSEAGLKLVRMASGSSVASFARHDWHCWKNRPITLITSLVVFFSLAAWIRHLVVRDRNVLHPQDSIRPTALSENEDNETFLDWWTTLVDGYLMDCFFRPSAPIELDLEDGLEMIIQRLAVPNFWLQPFVNSDYIKELQVWEYWDKATLNKKCNCNREGNGSQISDVDGTDSECRQGDSNTSEDEVYSRNSQDCSCTFEAKRNKPHSTSFWDHRGKDCDISRQVPSGMLERQECAICLELYKNGTVLCGLPCGHNYHHRCIVLWLTRDNHHCPDCRWPAYKVKTKNCQSHLHPE